MELLFRQSKKMSAPPRKMITDFIRLRKIILFLADNIGNNTSATSIGKIDNQEVDFIVTREGEKKYIRVTETMNAPETRERELTPLRKIRDSYEKIVLALDSDRKQTEDGIKIVKVVDYLLEDE